MLYSVLALDRRGINRTRTAECYQVRLSLCFESKFVWHMYMHMYM